MKNIPQTRVWKQLVSLLQINQHYHQINPFNHDNTYYLKSSYCPTMFHSDSRFGGQKQKQLHSQLILIVEHLAFHTYQVIKTLGFILHIISSMGLLYLQTILKGTPNSSQSQGQTFQKLELQIDSRNGSWALQNLCSVQTLSMLLD